MTKLLEYISRKFVLALLALGTSFWLALEKLPMSEYVMALGVVLGFYNGANVMQDYLYTKKNPNQENNTPSEGK